MNVAASYLKHVQMQVKAGTKDVKLRWVKDTVGGVDRWMASYGDGKVVIYAPAKHGFSLYQVYWNNEHFSNADTLAKAKAAGVRAAAYYTGKAPNAMGRMRKNPRAVIGSGAPRGLWGRAVDALAAFKKAGNAWRDAGRPRSGPIYADFVAAEQEYGPLRDEVDRWDWNDEQRAEWERVNRAFDPLLPGQQGYKANPRRRKPARRRNPGVSLSELREGIRRDKAALAHCEKVGDRINAALLREEIAKLEAKATTLRKKNPGVAITHITRGAPFDYGKLRAQRTYIAHFSDGSTSTVGPGVIGDKASEADVRHYFRNILAEKNLPSEWR